MARSNSNAANDGMITVEFWMCIEEKRVLCILVCRWLAPARSINSLEILCSFDWKFRSLFFSIGCDLSSHLTFCLLTISFQSRCRIIEMTCFSFLKKWKLETWWFQNGGQIFLCDYLPMRLDLDLDFNATEPNKFPFQNYHGHRSRAHTICKFRGSTFLQYVDIFGKIYDHFVDCDCWRRTNRNMFLLLLLLS